MTHISRISLAIAALLTAAAASAQEAKVPVQSADSDKTGWNGTVGAGPMFLPKYTGGQSQQVLPLPLLSINYDETFYVEIQRVGVYVLSSEDKKFGLGLAAEPRLGFTPSDGPRVAGMATRRASIEGGFTIDLDLDVLAFSAAWLNDLNRTSRGQSLRFSVYAPVIKNKSGEIGLIAGADHMNSATSRYFFGVRANEATATRAAYTPKSGTSASIGFGGTYRLGESKRGWGGLIFGANIGLLPSAVSGSPIVETRKLRQTYLGYGFTL
jgi:outer membrane protein